MKFNKLVPEIAVSDIEKSLKFYTKVLGFKVEYQRPESKFAFLSFQGSQIMIDAINKDTTWKTGNFEYPLGRGINFQIQVKKISPLIQKLKKHNIKLFIGPEEKWYRVKNVKVGQRQFLVQDPDGYLLRFFEDLGRKPVK